jgi:hypothetical protein
MWTRIRLQTIILTEYLRRAFNNGTYRLTFDDIARDVFKIKIPTDAHIDAVLDAWQLAQKKLREIHDICTMKVTAVYFNDYPKSEPKGEQAINLCIAGYGGRKAAGLRLMALNTVQNDPMALAYFKMRGRVLGGQVAAVEDRAVTLWKTRRLSKRVARKQVEIVNEPVLPYHDEDFKKLME